MAGRDDDGMAVRLLDQRESLISDHAFPRDHGHRPTESTAAAPRHVLSVGLLELISFQA